VQYPDYKPSLASPPLTDDELQALDDLLSALPGEQAMNIEMLDGYLTALLLAPTPVAQRRAADWMPVVWGGDGDGSDAPFASGKQKKNAIVLVLRHLHAIDDALHRHPDRWEPVFSVADAAPAGAAATHQVALDLVAAGLRPPPPAAARLSTPSHTVRMPSVVGHLAIICTMARASAQQQFADEGAVDLQRVEREAPQVGQRRIAGAEVVQRDAHAQAAQGVQLLEGAVRRRR
jgi:hypothetical protein